MTFYGIELCCPYCKGELEEEAKNGDVLRCTSCGKVFPVVLGIPDLRVFPDPYIDMEADREKGRKIAARFDDLNFEGLVHYYYSITPKVPSQHAQQYTRGLLTAQARAESSIRTWEQLAEDEHASPGTSLLEVGCGTAPLLVAASPRFSRVVGVDIAFRWLVMAKKRVSEAGLEIPLICACAEALPFPEGTFDRVVLDSALEHFHDQKKAISECHRVLRPGSYLFAATPNRFSLGPDPHTGLWAGSLLPEKLVAAYVRRLGGIPPRRKLFSASSFVSLLQEAGFQVSGVMLPDIPAGQRVQLSWVLNRAVDLYHFLKRRFLFRKVLQWCGPILNVVVRR